ncbi:uncharacterized protein B4U80_06677, partial [Leptotrombidium deliense]
MMFCTYALKKQFRILHSVFKQQWGGFNDPRDKALCMSMNFINENNEKQIMVNQQIFGSLKSDDTIIAIQVHNRSDYLKIAIDALEKVKGIEKTLIVFSHSVFDPKINKLVRNIKFAKVMQIFYPYSTQLFPHSFPGDDPND